MLPVKSEVFRLKLAATIRQDGRAEGCTVTRRRSPGHKAQAEVYKFDDRNSASALNGVPDWTAFPGPVRRRRSTKRAQRTSSDFNCLNCHNRDGEGGIDELAGGNKMKSLEKAENADDVAAAAAHRRRLQDAHELADGRAAWPADAPAPG